MRRDLEPAKNIRYPQKLFPGDSFEQYAISYRMPSLEVSDEACGFSTSNRSNSRTANLAISHCPCELPKYPQSLFVLEKVFRP